MDNNIFIKKSKNKFNPDIEQKFKKKENERDEINFELSNNIYNPITGIVPNKINSMKDLELTIDNSKININKLINNKATERTQQDELFKSLKTKIIDNTIINNKPQETHEDMKKKYVNKVNLDNYNNILDGLKDLGIIK